jgi:tetratricopeptide (TPR) repeat protein
VEGIAIDWRGLADEESLGQYLQESYAISSELGDRWIATAALTIRAEYKCSRGAIDQGIQDLQESLTVMREIGDGQAVQYILDNLGYWSRLLGHYEGARQYHLESLDVADEVGDGLGVAGSLHNLAVVAYDEGEYETAMGYAEQGLALRRQLGRTWETGFSLHLLGDIELARGAADEALLRYRESLDVVEEFEWLQVDAWRSMGEAYLALGDLVQAKQHLRTALDLAVRIEALDELLNTLRATAHLAAETGETEWATGVLAHALSHPNSHPKVQAATKTLLADLESKLPPEAITAAQDRGRGKTLDEIVQESLEVLGA